MRGKKKKFAFEIDDNGCFVCTSHITNLPHKAPVTTRKGGSVTIPRYIYEECFGEVPDGMVVRHKCDNHICINPAHLEIGTHVDNMRDMVERNRSTLGEKNPASKLTTEEMRVIKRLQGNLSITKVAEKYNISVRQVWRLWTGENWKEVV